MFSFKVVVYEDENLETYTGFVPGQTYKEALCVLIADNFVENDVVAVELKYVTDSTILMVPEGIVEVLREENNV